MKIFTNIFCLFLLPVLLSCSVIVPEILPNTCSTEEPLRCEGNILLECVENIEFRVDCGFLSCDPFLQSCGACGDGSTAPAESCDDGNLTNGDGCTAFCTVEPGHLFESEANDKPNEANGFIVETTIVHGAITPAGDIDFFLIDLFEVSDLSFETFDTDPQLASCNGGMDTQIRLIAPDQETLLASDDEDGISSCSKIDSIVDKQVRQLAADTYYIAVEDFGNDTEIPGYQLLVRFDAICNDGILEGFETCDDGNGMPGDGCNQFCQTEVCGDDKLDVGEECDDGNTQSGDGCEADCTLPD